MISRTSAFSVAGTIVGSGTSFRPAGVFRKGCSLGVALGALATLAACTGNEVPPAPVVGGVPGSTVGQSRAVGLILPLTGRNAAIGVRMRDAAVLALSTKGSPALDVHDSNGPGGALQAAQAATSRGDTVILGPLTSTDTASVASVTAGSSVPELAFTSDSARAQPGVWVLGLTPEQQVRRMVDAARAVGRTKFAAFLPDNPLGHATAEGLTRACQDAGLATPDIAFHEADEASIIAGLKTLSAIETRAPAVPASTPAPAATGPSAIDPTADVPANDAPAQPATPTPPAVPATVAPPPFDGLVLADTGLALAQVITQLQADHVDSKTVQIMGPALWKAFDGKLGALHGAWYAAPDSHDRDGYVARYRAVYHQQPSPVTDLAYDAAALAGALSRQGEITTQALTRPDGFMGVDGLFTLRPDGHVTRALAVYQIQQGGGARVIVPASRQIAVPAHPS